MTRREQASCSTVIVGKNASTTGRVLLGHNEDDFVCEVQSHIVPHRTHKEGDVLRFDDGPAVIPQIPETLGYLWIEQRCPGGEPFADAYYNECGVALVSNKGFDSHITPRDKDHQGIGYGIRQIVAERAHTAREGVEVIKYLMDNFGYYSGRTYEIADKDEAWVVQLTTGRNFAAQRVGDDEIYYMPNWYTIHQIDFNDTEHRKFYWSDTLVSDAIENGWYTPAKEGDWSDFDFAEVWQNDNVMIPFNMLRTNLAWPKITGGETMPYKTFSIKAPKKYSPEDIREILRLTVQGTDQDKEITADWKGYGIGHDWTVDSGIYVFDDDPALTCIYRAFPIPAKAPYVPWYGGITRVPKGYEWMGWEAAQASHFHVSASEFRHDDRLAYWAFHDTAMAVNILGDEFAEKLTKDIADFEAVTAKFTPLIEAGFRELAKTDREAALEFLTQFTEKQAQNAWDWAKEELNGLTEKKYSEVLNAWMGRIFG